MTVEEFERLPALSGCPGKPACDKDCPCGDHRDVFRFAQRLETQWRDQIIAAREARDRADLRIGELQKDLTEYRKMLWVLARNAGLALHIPKADLDAIPEGAELLCWYEGLFDSMVLKGICSPTGDGKPVV